MTVKECWEESKSIAGVPPYPPLSRDIVPDNTGDLGGVGDGKGKNNPPQPFPYDQNNALLLQQYQTELQAYNERLKVIFDALLKENMKGPLA